MLDCHSELTATEEEERALDEETIEELDAAEELLTTLEEDSIELLEVMLEELGTELLLETAELEELPSASPRHFTLSICKVPEPEVAWICQLNARTLSLVDERLLEIPQVGWAKLFQETVFVVQEFVLATEVSK